MGGLMFVLADVDTGAPAGIGMDIGMVIIVVTGMVITGVILQEPERVTGPVADPPAGLVVLVQLQIMYTVTVPMVCSPPGFEIMRHSQMQHETKLEILTGRGRRGTHKTGPRPGLQISPIMYTVTAMVMSSAGTTTGIGNKGKVETGRIAPVIIRATNK